MEIRINLYQAAGNLESLSGRPSAIKIIEDYKPQFKYLQSGDKLICDFENIVTATASFLAELLGGLRGIVSEKTDILLVIEHINEEVRMDIEAMITYMKVKSGVAMCFVCQEGEALELIGIADAKSTHVFGLLKKQNLSARQLADMDNIGITNASNQLARLYKAGLTFRREIVDSEGKMFLYYLR